MNMRKGSKGTARTTRTPASVAPLEDQAPHQTALVHVALQGVGCAAIPRADLLHRDHFVVWSRFYASLGPGYDLWGNSAWRGVASAIFRADLEAISAGDRPALSVMLVSLPQSVALTEVRLALVDVLTHRDRQTLRVLLAEVQKRKALRPNGRQSEDAARVQESLNVENFRRQFKVTQPRGKKASFRGAITSLSGEDPETDGAARRLHESAQAGSDRERTLYRVQHDVGHCSFHLNAEDVILPDFHSDELWSDPGCPGIKDPEAVPRRRTRRRLPRPELHLIAGLDG
ncbi:MAG: hypothetical protein IPO09_02365 [Anaeromyxobacter sp.]|nr:hypothetical protein [Anaeromyxobacter sp.]